MSNTSKQIMAIVACFIVLAIVHIAVNAMKEAQCVSSGGIYIKNSSDATLSSCVKG